MKTPGERSMPLKTKIAKPSIGAKKIAAVEDKPLARRDGTGHLDPKYAADLRARSVASAEDHTVDRAFLRPTTKRRVPLAQELGREAVMTMTSAEDQSDQLQAQLGEEVGGPFVVTTADQELALGTDPSNPLDATREPFPRT